MRVLKRRASGPHGGGGCGPGATTSTSPDHSTAPCSTVSASGPCGSRTARGACGTSTRPVWPSSLPTTPTSLAGVDGGAAGEPTGRLFRLDGWLGQRLRDSGQGSSTAGLSAVGRSLAARGVTAVTDASVTSGPDELTILAAAAADGRLPFHVTAMTGRGGHRRAHPLSRGRSRSSSTTAICPPPTTWPRRWSRPIAPGGPPPCTASPSPSSSSRSPRSTPPASAPGTASSTRPSFRRTSSPRWPDRGHRRDAAWLRLRAG